MYACTNVHCIRVSECMYIVYKLELNCSVYALHTLYVYKLELNCSTYACSAGFTYMYRLDRLKPRTSKFRGPPAKVYDIFNTVIGLSQLCCHNVLFFLNNPSVIFPFRIVQNFKHLSSSLPLLKLIKHTYIFPSREGGESEWAS